VAQVFVQIREPKQELQQHLFLIHAVIRAVLRKKIHGKVCMLAELVKRFRTDHVSVPA